MTSTRREQGILYVVATPIGNLSDLSPRAVETLKSADIVLAEDTRVTGGLLSFFDIRARQISYHDHNEKSRAPSIISDLKSGKNVALVSDAGTPLISDPGYTLLNLAIGEDIEIIPVPGPCSITAALSICGFPCDRFCFEGYAPRSQGKLRRFYSSLAGERRTIVFFETPHRLKKSLDIMSEELGDREIFIGRELTKKFEEKFRGKIGNIKSELINRTIKGELVVVVKGHE